MSWLRGFFLEQQHQMLWKVYAHEKLFMKCSYKVIASECNFNGDK